MKIFGTSFLVLTVVSLYSCRQSKERTNPEPRPEFPVAPTDDDPLEDGKSGDFEAVCQLLEEEGMLRRERSPSLHEATLRIVVTDGADSKREGVCPELLLKD